MQKSILTVVLLSSVHALKLRKDEESSEVTEEVTDENTDEITEQLEGEEAPSFNRPDMFSLLKPPIGIADNSCPTTTVISNN